MTAKTFFIFYLISLLTLPNQIESRLEFTNLVCKSFDKKYAEPEYCILKSVNRSYKYVSGKFNIYQLPLRVMKINISLWRRSNGYQPFLFNRTYDVCKFLKHRKSNPKINFIHESYVGYSNLNTSCPINHNIILEKFPASILNHRLTEVLPFPDGHYRVEVRWMNSEALAIFAKISFSFS